MGGQNRGDLIRAVDSIVQRQATVPRVKRWQPVYAVSQYGDAFCFQVFECARQIENGLDACADHGDRRPRQFFEVRRHVERVFVTPVHAADAAGGE